MRKKLQHLKKLSKAFVVTAAINDADDDTESDKT